MAQSTVDLIDGITVGETVNKFCTIRTLTMGDLLSASEKSEKCVQAVTGRLNEDGSPELEPQLVSSPALMNAHTTAAQIVSIGELKAPIDIDILRKLSATDMQIINNKINELDEAEGAKIKQLEQEVAQRGRSDNESE